MLSIIQRRISSNSLFRWLCANWVWKTKAMVVGDCLLTRHMWLKGKWVARRGKGELHGILQILWRRLHSPQGPMFAGLLGKTLVLTKSLPIVQSFTFEARLVLIFLTGDGNSGSWHLKKRRVQQMWQMNACPQLQTWQNSGIDAIIYFCWVLACDSQQSEKLVISSDMKYGEKNLYQWLVRLADIILTNVAMKI